jgi:hypothetical protein
MTYVLEHVHLLNDQGLDHPKGTLQNIIAWAFAWVHGTIPRRVSYLQSLIDNPGRERRFQRSMVALRWGLLAALVAITLVFGEIVGWDKVVRQL